MKIKRDVIGDLLSRYNQSLFVVIGGSAFLFFIHGKFYLGKVSRFVWERCLDVRR